MNNIASAVASSLIETVQTLYTAFGRGDIPALLAHLSDEVEWRMNVDPAAPGANRVPDFRTFRGKAGVQEFFSLIGTGLEFHSFLPQSFLSGGNDVVARVQVELTVRSTGSRVRAETLHYFTFDSAQRVIRFTEYVDTLAVAAAWDVIRAK